MPPKGKYYKNKEVKTLNPFNSNSLNASTDPEFERPDGNTNALFGSVTQSENTNLPFAPSTPEITDGPRVDDTVKRGTTIRANDTTKRDTTKKGTAKRDTVKRDTAKRDTAKRDTVHAPKRTHARRSPTVRPGPSQRKEQGRSFMVNSDGQMTDVKLSQARQARFHTCLSTAASDRERYNLDGVTYRNPLTMDQIGNLLGYLQDTDTVSEVGDLFTYTSMMVAQNVLCRWPRPSELAEMAYMFDNKADTVYYTGIVYVQGDDVPMLVGKDGAQFASITERFNLLYMWMSRVPKNDGRTFEGTHQSIFVYSKNPDSIIEALSNINDVVVPELQNAGFDVSVTGSTFAVTKRDLKSEDEPFGNEFASNPDVDIDQDMDILLGHFDQERGGVNVLALSLKDNDKRDEYVQQYLQEVPGRLPRFVTNYLNQYQLPEGKELNRERHARGVRSSSRETQKRQLLRERKGTPRLDKGLVQMFRESGMSKKAAEEKAASEAHARANVGRGKSKGVDYLAQARNAEQGINNALRERDQNAAETNRIDQNRFDVNAAGAELSRRWTQVEKQLAQNAAQEGLARRTAQNFPPLSRGGKKRPTDKAKANKTRNPQKPKDDKKKKLQKK